MSREERKVVTVLFTDLVGFTDRAEELDPDRAGGSQVRIAARFMCTWVEAYRGRLDVALPASAETLADSRKVGDPQSLASSLLLRAFVLHSAGCSQEAHGLIDELLALNALMKAAYLDSLPLFSAELGRESDYLAAAAASTGKRAAEIYSGMGACFVEHWARLLAAERGGRPISNRPTPTLPSRRRRRSSAAARRCSPASA